MSNSREIIHSIYVTLDCLLDTRLGTLAMVNESLMERTLLSGYVVREEENFPPLKKETFLELYKTRDKEVLKISPMTICVQMVTELALKVMTRAVDTPIATGVQIVINTYPYKLTDTEAKDLITSFIVFTQEFISVKVIYLPEEDLTPSYCAKNFNLMVMYNYDEWLDIHAKKNNFRNIKSAKMMVFGPKIFFNRKPNLEERKVMERNKIEPFRLIEELASNVISLKLLDIAVFSVDMLRYAPKTEESKTA